MTAQETLKVDAEIAQLNANTAKIQVEIIKILEETKKLSRETAYYPLIAAGTAGAAFVGLTALIIKYF